MTARPTPGDETFGPVPESNRPGHRPSAEQDKPTGPPPRPPGAVPRTTHFRFRFDWPMAAAAFLVGVTPRTTDVEVGEEHLTVRFGAWSLCTPLGNISGTHVTGPYAWPKVVGPPRLSVVDSGVTFATTSQAGVCIELDRPEAGALPFGLLRHRALTITVDEPDGFVEELEAAVRRVT